jgi:hypothetical protein
VFAGLEPGTYKVASTQPAGYLDGKETLGSASGTKPSNDVMDKIVLGPGVNAVDYLFGELGASLGDKVWNDANKNGKQDSGEAGLVGVKATLIAAGADAIFGTADDVKTVTTTNNTGNYLFSGLKAGQYQVEFSALNGYLFSPANIDTNDSIDSDAIATTGKTGTYTLAAGQSNTSVDAGLYRQIATNLTKPTSFWNGASGQDLIKSFGGSASSTALANWLATSFSNLYGSSAGSMNLTGKTNTYVASLFQTVFADANRQADAQVLATALSVFTTNTSLNTNSAARTKATSLGFALSSSGAGAASYNVGANGAAFGLANNTSKKISELLTLANSKAIGGVLNGGNQSLILQTRIVFSGING